MSTSYSSSVGLRTRNHLLEVDYSFLLLYVVKLSRRCVPGGGDHGAVALVKQYS